MASYPLLSRQRTVRFGLLLLALASSAAHAHAQSAQPPASPLRVVVHASPAANYLYQLDCVAGVIFACARDDYAQLWRTEFLRTPADSNALNEWRRLRARYDRYVPIDTQGMLRTGLNLSEKIRVAAFQSETVDDFLVRLDLLTLAEDRASWAATTRYFWPTWNSWWQRTASAPMQRFAQATRELLARDTIRTQLNSFAAFYRAQLPPNDSVTMTLFFRPDLARSNASGQQIGNYSVVEFLPTETPERRLSVVLHELCHFLFRQAPPTDYNGLRARFTVAGKTISNARAANAAYNLLNEGLASVFGNGMIERTLRSKQSWERYIAAPGSFYYNNAIDRVAKGLLPWMDSVVTRGGSLHDSSWVRDYVSRTAQIFGGDVGLPRLQLAETWFFVDQAVSPFSPLSHALRNELGVSSLYGSASTMQTFSPQTLNELPGLPALLVVAPTGLPALERTRLISANALAALTTAAKSGDLLFAGEQTSGAPLYVIVARDAAGAEVQLRRLSAVSQSFAGVLPSPGPAKPD